MGLKYRKSVQIVVYKIETGKIFYLILHRKKHWNGFEFPKGGIEKGESELDAVKRETKEEAGLKIKKILRYNVRGKFDYPRELADRKGFIGQSYRLFSAEVFPGRVKIDKHEHSGYEWLGFKGAIKKLTHQEQKDCLKVVEKKLSEL